MGGGDRLHIACGVWLASVAVVGDGGVGVEVGVVDVFAVVEVVAMVAMVSVLLVSHVDEIAAVARVIVAVVGAHSATIKYVVARVVGDVCRADVSVTIATVVAGATARLIVDVAGAVVSIIIVVIMRVFRVIVRCGGAGIPVAVAVVCHQYGRHEERIAKHVIYARNLPFRVATLGCVGIWVHASNTESMWVCVCCTPPLSRCTPKKTSCCGMASAAAFALAVGAVVSMHLATVTVAASVPAIVAVGVVVVVVDGV